MVGVNLRKNAQHDQVNLVEGRPSLFPDQIPNKGISFGFKVSPALSILTSLTVVKDKAADRVEFQSLVIIIWIPWIVSKDIKRTNFAFWWV